MQDWVTIHRVDILQDAFLIKVQLELEDIEVEIPDEFTTQALQFYSNGIGGVRIQVREFEREKAIYILTNLGYIKIEEVKQNKVIVWLDNLTSKIPVLKKLRLEVRVLAFLAVVLFMLLAPFYDLSIPSLSDKILEKNWCIAQVKYKGKVIEPIRQEYSLVINNCTDNIWFHENGLLNMPNYKEGNNVKAWNEYKDGLYLHTDLRYLETTETSVFEGAYEVVLKDRKLELKSKTIYILLYDYSY